jgi:hypothetical protein
MKLISKGEQAQHAEILPIAVNAIDIPLFTDAVQARASLHDDARPFIIIPVTPLSWRSSNLPKVNLSINQGLREWMDFDLAIKNWIYTCLTAFLQMGNEWACPVPDQYIEDMGIDVVVFTRDGDKVNVMA